MGKGKVWAGDLLKGSKESTLALVAELLRGSSGLAVAENDNVEGHSG
jgi:hypothetical protein